MGTKLERIEEKCKKIIDGLSKMAHEPLVGLQRSGQVFTHTTLLPPLGLQAIATCSASVGLRTAHLSWGCAL